MRLNKKLKPFLDKVRVHKFDYKLRKTTKCPQCLRIKSNTRCYGTQQFKTLEPILPDGADDEKYNEPILFLVFGEEYPAQMKVSPEAGD